MNEKVTNAVYWLLDRLGESSTWRGIVLTLTGLGIAVEPEQAAKITACGLALVGVINIFRQGSPTKKQVAEALDTKVDRADGSNGKNGTNGAAKVVGLVGLIGLVGLMCGCTSLDPAGPYHGDKVLYQADATISASYDLLHAFVLWEKERRPALAGTPEVTRYADYVRANSKAWIRSALALRDAYAADPGGDPAALKRAMAVLREAMVQASMYMVASTN